MSQLTIYKASAGSGKTFTLTRNFLLLLFQEKENYKHILAATFTNKATEEMKTRIISELYTLAQGLESGHREYLREHLPQIKSDDHLNNIAKNTLANILHDYSHLSITTIDRFFQKIIRSFAREIRVSSNYNIELDDRSVLKKVSEQLFFDLEKRGNEELVDWMTRFAEEQIENGNSWNFSESIGKLSEEFLSEDYKRASSENGKTLGDFVILKDFLNKITKHQAIIKNGLKDIAQKGLSIAEGETLVSTDFKYGKSSGINFLYNIASGIIPDKIGKRTLEMTENLEAWYTKTSAQKASIETAYYNGLDQVLSGLVQNWSDSIELYLSIDLIRANFYSLGILSDLERQLQKYTDENNILLLSNSNELIANIIDESDTPFIYEKTGNTYKHFMIDEFQDTSKLQWTNLKPLISNSLAEGKKNLIVGDVKQSIYRWRNSDWKQLDHGIKDEFGHSATVEVLPTNWRSSKGIIKFNNTLIKATANHLKQHFNNATESDPNSPSSQLFSSAYSDIIQEVPKTAKEGGYVSFQFYNKENHDQWKEDVITRLPKIIETAQDNGHSLSDIAILVRKNSEGAMVSRYLLNYAASHPESNYRYDVISDEALWISGSYDVQFLVNIFKYLMQPNKLVAAQLNIIHNNYLGKATHSYWNETSLNPVIEKKLEKLTSLSLLETTEELITRFNLGNQASEAIFIQSFIDIINDFEYQQSGSINEFLIWWEENGKTRSISTPEGQDAINILTVHKSKGLEYKIIIVPFLDWDIAKDRGYLWTSTDTEPLNEIPYLPVRLSSKLKKSLFKEEYEREKLMQYIDSINLLYVAFTRAKEALIGFGDSANSSCLDGILPKVFTQETPDTDTSFNLLPHWKSDELHFEYGTFPTSNTTPKEAKNTLTLAQYKVNEHNKNLKLRLQSHDFEVNDNQITTSAAKKGKIWHRLFEKINTLGDLPEAIDSLALEGVVSSNAAQELLTNVSKAIQQPIVESWFSPEAKITNEAAILTPSGNTYRPDRLVELNNQLIVVDFKFGTTESNSYKKQVKNYIHQIKQMGKENVRGYLWYINLNKVVEVKY